MCWAAARVARAATATYRAAAPFARHQPPHLLVAQHLAQRGLSAHRTPARVMAAVDEVLQCDEALTIGRVLRRPENRLLLGGRELGEHVRAALHLDARLPGTRDTQLAPALGHRDHCAAAARVIVEPLVEPMEAPMHRPAARAGAAAQPGLPEPAGHDVAVGVVAAPRR